MILSVDATSCIASMYARRLNEIRLHREYILIDINHVAVMVEFRRIE